MSNDDKQQFHWFMSSQFNWCADDDLAKCIERQKREDKSTAKYLNGGKRPRHPLPFNVFKVPLPDDDKHPYRIEDYRPQVEGTEYIATCNKPT